VEAARRSGTLVTARFAAEQGREVFALPGHPLDPRAEGTNQLLKAGATLVTQPQDVLDALAPQLTQQVFREHPPATPEAWPTSPRAIAAPVTLGQNVVDRVLAALGPHPVDIDELARAAGLGAREMRVLLMELDLAGEITRHGYQLVSRDPGKL
jgi:DNA processing protein